MSVAVIWLLVGAGLIALEVTLAPGIGFLFAGLAAIITGAAIEFGMVGADDSIAQAAVFLIATSVFAALLWKRLKAWRRNPSAPLYSNIVGTDAVVVGTLNPGEEGNVQWSGTLMRAKLEGTAPLTKGATVTVIAIDGNVLTVKSK